MNIFLLLLIGLLILIIFCLIVWAGIESVKASYDVKRISGYKQSEELQSVHKYMTTASIISWISVIVIIGIIILLLFFSPELFSYTAVAGGKSTFSFVSLLMFGSLGILLALLITIGVFSAMSWDKMKKSKVEESDKYKVTLDHIKKTTYLTIGSVGILLLLIIIYFAIKITVSTVKKNKLKKEKNELLDTIVKYA